MVWVTIEVRNDTPLHLVEWEESVTKPCPTIGERRGGFSCACAAALSRLKCGMHAQPECMRVPKRAVSARSVTLCTCGIGVLSCDPHSTAECTLKPERVRRHARTLKCVELSVRARIHCTAHTHSRIHAPRRAARIAPQGFAAVEKGILYTFDLSLRRHDRAHVHAHLHECVHTRLWSAHTAILS